MNELSNELVESLKASLQELLRRLKQDRERILSEIQRVEGELAALGIDATESMRTKKRRRARGANRNSVKAELEKSPQKKFSVVDLAETIKIPRSSVRAALKKLVAEGSAQEEPKGWWQNTEAVT